ncbi:MAG: hypothetical protein HN826_14370 [Methylococcales bacterium]|jgi:hypothetical protein|nr:hypothetical protein [Methylococcales bacterium]
MRNKGLSNAIGSQYVIFMGIICLLATLASGALVIKRDLDRRSSLNFTLLERDISDASQAINRLNTSTKLSKLFDNWSVAKEVARQSGSTLVMMNETGFKKYTGSAQSWLGAIRGSTQQVLTTAWIMQKKIPVYYNSIVVDNGNAVLSFSLLGKRI